LKTSPYYEPFEETEVPVLMVSNELDEFTFQAAEDYKAYKFENIE
jgi:molecular chaperone HtpG/TNF receptor-associated protein 1